MPMQAIQAKRAEPGKGRLHDRIALVFGAGSAGPGWAALLLESDEASYITGVCLPVDGGLSCRA